MSAESTGGGPVVVNHHAAYPGCAGAVGVMAGLAMLVGDRRAARQIVDFAGLSADDRLIDIGCGPGNAVRQAARRAAVAIGVDPSTAMLRIARHATRTRPRSGNPGEVRWVEGCAEELPVPAASATVVLTVKSVHHWKNVATGLNQSFRVLQAGGRLLAVERLVRPDARGLASHGWTIQQAESFADLCLQTGFGDVVTTTERFGRYSAVVVQGVRP